MFTEDLEPVSLTDFRVDAVKFAGVMKVAEECQIAYQTVSKFVDGTGVAKRSEKLIALGTNNALATRLETIQAEIDYIRSILPMVRDWVEEFNG